MSISTFLTSCFNSGKISTPDKSIEMITKGKESFHTLKAVNIDGKEVSMEQYKGKKIIVLNVASKCGYTKQYADWQAFYEQHSDKAEILGFPSNQFMGQEPGSEAEIKEFCQLNYGVSFPLFEKVDVKGKDQSPVYEWLTNPDKNGWNSDVPSWNFCKYLIDEEGRLTHFFASGVKPDSPEFIEAFGKI
jgi:glutathione peroxidase